MERNHVDDSSCDSTPLRSPQLWGCCRIFVICHAANGRCREALDVVAFLLMSCDSPNSRNSKRPWCIVGRDRGGLLNQCGRCCAGSVSLDVTGKIADFWMDDPEFIATTPASPVLFQRPDQSPTRNIGFPRTGLRNNPSPEFLNAQLGAGFQPRILVAPSHVFVLVGEHRAVDALAEAASKNLLRIFGTDHLRWSFSSTRVVSLGPKQRRTNIAIGLNIRLKHTVFLSRQCIIVAGFDHSAII